MYNRPISWKMYDTTMLFQSIKMTLKVKNSFLWAFCNGIIACRKCFQKCRFAISQGALAKIRVQWSQIHESFQYYTIHFTYLSTSYDSWIFSSHLKKNIAKVVDFLRNWGNNLESQFILTFLATNFNLVAKKKKFLDCRARTEQQ